MKIKIDKIAREILEYVPQQARMYYQPSPQETWEQHGTAAGEEILSAIEQHIAQLPADVLGSLLSQAPVSMMENAPFDVGFDDVPPGGMQLLLRTTMFGIEARMKQLAEADVPV